MLLRVVNMSTLWGAGCLLSVAGLLVALTPGLSSACACGCSVFEVGTPSLIPDGAGGTVWLEYHFMNQHISWHASVWRDANSDKQIKTSFLTAGLQYMSLGLLAGFKLPTGDYIYNSFDRDTSI